jgi:hypothetical protein
MKQAFDAAWDTLKTGGSVDAAAYKAEWARETIALRIIEMVQRGEHDISKLQADALVHLATAQFAQRSQEKRGVFAR